MECQSLGLHTVAVTDGLNTWKGNENFNSFIVRSSILSRLFFVYIVFDMIVNVVLYSYVPGYWLYPQNCFTAEIIKLTRTNSIIHLAFIVAWALHLHTINGEEPELK